jgi:hypothetical protein
MLDEPLYVENALAMAARKIPVGFLPKGQKKNIEVGWEDKATIATDEIVKKAQQNPTWQNICLVAKAVPSGRLFWDIDDPAIVLEYEKFYGKLAQTLKNQTFSGGYHYIFEHTEESLAFQKEVSKAYISESGANGELWSLRMHNAYIVGPGSSVTKDGITGYYKIVEDAPIATMPDTLLTFLKDRYLKSESGKKNTNATDDGQPISEGGRNSQLTSIGGKLRAAGSNQEEIEAVLSRINQERCQPPLGEIEIQTIARSVSRYEIRNDASVLHGGVPAGSQPDVISITAPSRLPQTTQEAEKYIDAIKQEEQRRIQDHWRENFKTVSELEEGEPIMLIKGFLPEGVTFFGSLPGESKTWIGLSVAKALTTQRDFMGRSDFIVPVVTPVIYLIPESGSRAFKRRCGKMGIPSDEKLFLCRTISEGKMLLSDPFLLEAVRRMKPVVFLDTLIRFNEADSENEAMQNKQLVDDITVLRQAGAIAIIPLHHATKSLRTQGLSLDTVLRGTGDISASADCVWGLLRDDSLYQNGQGPNEVEIVCVKARDIDPPPLPFRFALSRRIPRELPLAPGMSPGSLKIGLAPGIESVIDSTGDLQICENTAHQEKKAAEERRNSELIELITTKPAITLEELEAELDMAASSIGRLLKRLGWHKPKGGAKGEYGWVKKAILIDTV